MDMNNDVKNFSQNKVTLRGAEEDNFVGIIKIAATLIKNL